MTPILIGYFPKRPWNRAEDQRLLPPQIKELCNEGHMQAGAPPRWIDLWLNNHFWIYSTEAQAWAAAVGSITRNSFTSEGGPLAQDARLTWQSYWFKFSQTVPSERTPC